MHIVVWLPSLGLGKYGLRRLRPACNRLCKHPIPVQFRSRRRNDRQLQQLMTLTVFRPQVLESSNSRAGLSDLSTETHREEQLGLA